jgi:hypothetical protein
MDDEYFDGVTTLDAAAISTIESALACQSVPSDDVRQAVKVLVDRACHMCHGSHEGCNLKCDAGSAVRTILGDGVKP